MVKIRMRREGKKKHPIYKLVATDIHSSRDGGYLEALGQYDPHTDPITIKLNEHRIEYWLQKGAQPTDTVRSLLRRNGFWLNWTLKRQGKDEATVRSVVERWQMLQVDKQKHEADRKIRRAEKKKKIAAQAETPAPTSAPAPAVA